MQGFDSLSVAGGNKFKYCESPLLAFNKISPLLHFLLLITTCGNFMRLIKDVSDNFFKKQI